MKHLQGWALPVVWITVGLTLWLFNTVWPDLNGWLKDNQHLSGWMQFLGAVLAIIGAYHLGKMQAVAARALVREQQLVEALRFMQSIRKLLEHTSHTLRIFREGWQMDGAFRGTNVECGRMKVMIEKIDITRCHSPTLVEYLLQLPRLIDDVMAYQNYVAESYNNVVMTGRTEPGRREQTYVQEMRKTASVESFIGLAIEQVEEEEKAINEMRQHL